MLYGLVCTARRYASAVHVNVKALSVCLSVVPTVTHWFVYCIETVASIVTQLTPRVEFSRAEDLDNNPTVSHAHCGARYT